MALFNSRTGNLFECVSLYVQHVTTDPALSAVRVDHVALATFEDFFAFEFVRDPEDLCTFDTAKERQQTARMMVAVLAPAESRQGLVGLPKEKLAEFESKLAALTWPMDYFKKHADSGHVVKVKSCEFPDRSPVGSCLYRFDSEDMQYPAAKGEHQTRMVGQLITHHFRTKQNRNEGDTKLRKCLRAGGQWL